MEQASAPKAPLDLLRPEVVKFLDEATLPSRPLLVSNSSPAEKESRHHRLSRTFGVTQEAGQIQMLRGLETPLIEASPTWIVSRGVV